MEGQAEKTKPPLRLASEAPFCLRVISFQKSVLVHTDTVLHKHNSTISDILNEQWFNV